MSEPVLTVADLREAVRQLKAHEITDPIELNRFLTKCLHRAVSVPEGQGGILDGPHSKETTPAKGVKV